MRQPRPADAVRRFVVRAIEAAGAQKRLPVILEEEGILGPTGEPYSERAVSAWKTGDARVYSDVLFALARRLELSLDEYALEATEVTLGGRVQALERNVGYLAQRLDELLSDAGREPIDLPADLEAGA